MSVLRQETPEEYYKMPPVGITENRGKIGMTVHVNYTARCGSRECWFVGHAATSADAQLVLDAHECPTPPARNELPSGYSTLEKMWDELDDVTAAIMEGRGYNAGAQYLENNMLRGYARGVAFALSMMTHPHFRTITDIVKEAAKRYKIRTKKMPFEPTPGYRYNPLPPQEAPGGRVQPFHGRTTPAAPRKAAPLKATKAQKEWASKVDLSSLDQAQVKRIKDAYAMGIFTADELAKANHVTVETIQALVGK